MTQQQIRPDTRAMARDLWSTGDFDTIATVGTLRPAPELVRFADVRPGERVLDLATGTGAVAIAARRAGAHVVGVDVAPDLLDKAARHCEVARLDGIEWREGDVMDLDLPDGSFDVVLSQFGHMFAADPEATTAEMLRVLKPGGRVAVSTWPAEHYVGQMFAMNGRYVPPPPGVPSPLLWGDPAVVRERLGDGVRDVRFRRGVFEFPALSPRHYRMLFERHFGPTIKTVRALEGDPARLEAWRDEWDALVGQYFADCGVRHEYLMTRATRA